MQAASFVIKKNPTTNDPIDVSRELFDRKLRRITKNVTLTFDDSKVCVVHRADYCGASFLGLGFHDRCRFLGGNMGGIQEGPFNNGLAPYAQAR
jgi:hypothetical protein